jgi:hypothetical protein
MCDVSTALLAASTAAAIGGTAYNAQQQNAVLSANRRAEEATAARLNAARRAESARQEEFRLRGARTAAATQAAANPTAMIGAEEDAAAAREASLMPATESLMPGSATADPRLTGTATPGNTAVVQDGARELARALSQARGALRGRAFLSGAGDATAGFGRTLQEAGSDMANTGLLRQSSLSAYGVERSQSVPTFRSGNGLMGDLLIAGGGMGAGYAGRQAGRVNADARLAAAPVS